ncbi:MAG: DUF4126 domain-containing protein [Pyrinomonadaceae bacterium]|nr:DUF4126 domain-containing protein [Pyrinomonadaceae bacterium]
MDWLSTISLALGSAWTSGINLYATVAILGLAQKFQFAKLPGGLETLDNWWIIGIALGLYVVEFVADKVPYFDSIWDVIHTFIRIPAGAILAYSATGNFDPQVQTIAFLLGGGVAMTSHTTKTTARAFVNLSPEPFSNWILSLFEDVIAIVGAILAVFAPIVLAVFVVLFLLVFFYMLPRIWRTFQRMFRATVSFFRGDKSRVADLR